MIDPYRTLGVAPGASEADIKRAYRRLAKAFHPDAAGEKAIPRFLAIQAAYETLIGPDGRARQGRPGGRREPWRADPDRASATRDAWRMRGRRAGEAADAAPGASGRRSRRPSGTGTSGSGTSGPSSRERPRRRATPGSTSYDGVDQGPFDPEWSGASWYGATSGTYWTLNPREYADPRKHGPEYQARARRASTGPAGATEASDGATEASGGATEASGGASEAAADSAETASFRRSAAEAEWAPPPAPEGGAPGRAAAEAPPVRTVPQPPRWPAERRRRPNASDSGGSAALLGAAGRTMPGRLALALLGWPPIGLAMAGVLGELTGCARFAASCEESFVLLTWIAQFAILGGLLALPRLAAAATVGTLAMLAAAIPAVSVVSIGGGARDPDAASVVLVVILVAAWLVGVGIAAVRLRIGGSDRSPPAS